MQSVVLCLLLTVLSFTPLAAEDDPASKLKLKGLLIT